jgi:hypothetical protein
VRGQVTEPAETQRRCLIAMISAGVVLQALLVVFTVLYANVPAGYNAPYGLALYSVEFFRALWPYPKVSLSPDAFRTVSLCVVVSLWSVYFAAIVVLNRWRPAGQQSVTVGVILAFGILYNVVLVLIFPPVLSADLYHYALFGRMVVFHGLNPYVIPSSAVHSDPFWSLAIWRDMTTQYGPTWTLVSAAAAALGGDSVLRTVIMFKAVAALSNVAGGILVWRLARRVTGGNGVQALLLYAWNPLILIEAAGSGHNDTVMMTLALLGVWLAANGRMLAGLAILLSSALVKYLTLVLIVFYIAHCLTRERSWHKAASLALRMAAVAALALLVLYAPFLSGLDDPRQLFSGVAFNPMPSPMRSLMRAVVGRLLATLGGTDGPTSVIGVHLGFGALLLLLARGVVNPEAGWSQVFGRFSVASFIYVYLIFGGSFPWYLIAPLTASLLGPATPANRSMLAVCFGLGLGFMLGYTKLIAM